MVIFIGGLVGSGKTTLARALGKRLNVYYYDVDRVKEDIYPNDPDYRYNLDNKIPFSDKTRRKVFVRVVKDFEPLAQQHKNIIVDEILHKKVLRQVLFDGAKKYFGGYIIVWIKTDEAIVKSRLATSEREGHMLSGPFEWYLVYKKQFDDFENPDIIFYNNLPIDQAVSQLAGLVQGKINQPRIVGKTQI